MDDKSSYDGTLATRKILDEDTNLDMSKPNTTIQSETEIDDKVQDKLNKRLDLEVFKKVTKMILIILETN